LEEFIVRSAPRTEYFVLFDDLHEDFTGEPGVDDETDEYYVLLTGLLSAATHLHTSFRKNGKRIFPVIFLRDDIYDRIRHSDKNHWSDSLWTLHWDVVSLRSMVEHRICADAGKKHYADAWREAIADSPRISKADAYRTTMQALLDYMIEWTQHRPRDILKFCQLSARCALNRGGTLIESDDITEAQLSYSSYLKQEFDDEMHLTVPNYCTLVQLFGKRRASVLDWSEFLAWLQSAPEDVTNGRQPEDLVEALWYYGVISAGRDKEGLRFRYMDTGAQLGNPTKVMVHPGLKPALGF
jgi:hypothetical protein